ncbi:hypothetical protein RND81_14G153000 [Saponaria officinalis]|uniref:Uncharacterized protein n=1 Tax=Saponaria officinalis TaxID=3572 RepID=A0AAW1GQP0_SAPOF
MKELERQANEAKQQQQQQQQGSSTSSYPTSVPNYYGDNESEEQKLRKMRLQLIDDRIGAADESMTRTGAINTNHNVVYVINNNTIVQAPNYASNSSSTLPDDPISREQYLRNMRQQLIDAQIQAADESITRTGVIGTNNRLMYTDYSFVSNIR